MQSRLRLEGFPYLSGRFARKGKKMGCLNGKPVHVLPADDTNPSARAEALTKQRSQFNWVYETEGLFPHVNEVPESEKTLDAVLHQVSMMIEQKTITTELKLRQSLDEWTERADEAPWQDWKDLFGSSERSHKPTMISDDKWRSDEHFAWLRANGMNNQSLKRCIAIPGNIQVTDSDVKGLLPEGETLQSMLKANRLWILEYPMLRNKKYKKGYIPEGCSPTVLFIEKGENRTLTPIAAQMTPICSPEAPLFTPNDPATTWMAAKMLVGCADINFHEAYVHLFLKHIVMEAVYVAMRRTMAPTHPVLMLLEENFFYTIQINCLARQSLIGPEGVVTKLFALGFVATVDIMREKIANFDFSEEYNIPEVLKARGMGEDDNPPKDFLYCRDAIKIWKIIEKFVRGVISQVYDSDAKVIGDTELQDWITVLVGPLGVDGLGFKGIPGVASAVGSKMTKRDDVVLLVTMILYTVSAGHASVNNGQFQQYGFVPAHPAYFLEDLIRLAAKKAPIDEQKLQVYLPKPEDTRSLISVAYLLSLETADRLGSYDGKFFKQEAISKQLEGFVKDLADMEKECDARNSDPSYYHPYFYLNPRQVAQGIAI